MVYRDTRDYPDANGKLLGIGTIVTTGEGELEVVAYGSRSNGAALVTVRDCATNASINLASRMLTTVREPFAPGLLRIDQSAISGGEALFGILGITLNGRPIPCLQEMTLRMVDSQFATATFTVGVSPDATILDYMTAHQFIATESEEEGDE